MIAALLGILVIGDPGRIDRDKRWLRLTTGSLIGLISVVNATAAIKLVVNILDTANFTNNAHVLLVSGGAIWLTNVIAFGLWYWDVDRGGAAARARGATEAPGLHLPRDDQPPVRPDRLVSEVRGLPRTSPSPPPPPSARPMSRPSSRGPSS